VPASSIVERGTVRQFTLDGAELLIASSGGTHSRSLMSRAAGLALGASEGRMTIGTLCAHCGSAAHGQPFVEGHASCGVSFSRAGDNAVAAARDHSRIGVDIESLRAVAAHRVEDILLSTAERATGDHLGPLERDRYLARLWVAKEAVTKLVGLGLRIEGTTIEVRLDGAVGELTSWPETLGLATSPRITLFEVSDDIMGAIAVVD
jgi:phosphopantetheinyl transferase (holo-ACP synthase)